MKDFTWKIITTVEEWNEAIKDYQEGTPVACDTETYKQDPREGKLLGISISFRESGGAFRSYYIPFNIFNEVWRREAGETDLGERVNSWLSSCKILVGHNFTYDKRWLPGTTWEADTRLMWHLASAPSGPRPYGLKDLQVELLGWEARGDAELEANVKAKGGSLRKGDHYLADLEVLAKYACLDTYSTLLGYERLKPFFDDNDYWGLLRSIMAYNELLELNTTLGIAVDEEGLQRAHKRLLGAKEAAEKRLNKQLKAVIESLELDWVDRKVAKYKRDHNKTYYLTHPEEWERFNWNSDKHKRELFYDKLGNDVIYTTDSGKPSTNADSVKQMVPLEGGDWTQAYLKYEKSNTLTTSFSGPYLDSLRHSRLHPGFNICGTVSYRLSGFKPYLLNAPFDEKLILKNLVCDPGYVGIHADLAAIEPTVTAHYSDDPTLIKVFRDGLGDIYLDLALKLFPQDRELREGYDPYAPITKKVKERFSRQRKIAKVIQLAVQYTGTEHTVHRNLMKEGITDLSIWDCKRLVEAYWRTFSKVAAMNLRLRELNRKEGHLRNVIGRIIQVPDPDYKDLPNRFIQSSAHDILILWVMEIYRMHEERGFEIRPVLLDCHDSTSNQVPEAQAKESFEIYQGALDNINAMLGLSVTIRCEIKYFKTLAGLKNEE